jgi:uncharacterized protein YciW
VPVAALREAVRRAVAASSTRAVASAAKVNHQTVVNFAAGVKPHPSTVKKFTTWYVQQSVATHLDADSFAAAMALLMEGYPQAQRPLVRAGVLEALRQGYRKSGTEPPDWLK